MAGEVRAKALIAVEDWRVRGAVEEGKGGVGRWREEEDLRVGEGEVVAGLEEITRGHARVEDHDRPLVVVDGSDPVETRRGLEEEVSGIAR